ncbi:MAG TPA: hypothetical protein VER96_17895 [Polyangiaceae bacterium]|nr:hypothetical protein [Polyangiaceae bacterium]
MSSVLHHLGAVGWGWVALFAALDLIALTCAIVAVAGRKRRLALWALLGSACTTLASLVVTASATTVGLVSANAIPGSSIDPADKARAMAEGISNAMNGAALGIAATLIASIAAVACLIAALIYPSARVGQT